MPGIVAERASEQVTALRAARLQRGWSLSGLTSELWREADRQEVRIGSHPASVRSLIISWELGRRTPHVVYVKLLTAVYGTTAGALGLPEPKAFTLDDERLGRLFADYHGFVRAYIYKRVQDWHLADDLASETFLKTAESLAREGSDWMPDNPYRFLAVMARWTIADYHGQLRHKREFLPREDDSLPTWEWVATDALSQPEETVVGGLHVLDLVKGLSDSERELIALRFLDGMTMTAIQKRMGITPSQSYTMLRKSLERMRANAVITWSIPQQAKPMAVAA